MTTARERASAIGTALNSGCALVERPNLYPGCLVSIVTLEMAIESAITTAVAENDEMWRGAVHAVLGSESSITAEVAFRPIRNAILAEVERRKTSS